MGNNMFPLAFGGSAQLTLILTIAVVIAAYFIYKLFWSS